VSSKIIEFNREMYEGKKIPEHTYPRINAAFDLIKNEKITNILEIGPREAIFLRKMPKRVKKYAIDLFDVKVPKGTVFKKANAEEKIPFKDNFFDTIYAGEVIEHLFDTDAFLRECNRVLKKNGVFVLSTPNICNLRNMVKVLQKKQLEGIYFSIEPVYPLVKEKTGGHVRGYSPEAIKCQLQKHGFVIEKIVTHLVWFPKHDRLPKTLLDFVEKILVRIFNERGYSLIVKARKI